MNWECCALLGLNSEWGRGSTLILCHSKHWECCNPQSTWRILGGSQEDEPLSRGRRAPAVTVPAAGVETKQGEAHSGTRGHTELAKWAFTLLCWSKSVSRVQGRRKRQLWQEHISHRHCQSQLPAQHTLQTPTAPRGVCWELSTRNKSLEEMRLY